jgi:putative pyruvate formate lyase activating enzyme
VVAIVEAVRALGAHPVFVYNSNGYDRPEMLRLLEGRIDVYLPDFKYSDSLLGKRLSGVDDYPQTAIRAIGEMYRQKGSPLWMDDNGLAESGLIIRHLVLPGMVQQSIEALRMVAEEISASVHISLMSQYYPPFEISAFPELNRTLSGEEYMAVTNAFYELGFHKGWMQELGSDEHFRPHFETDKPFG